jgi:hypothetical protein
MTRERDGVVGEDVPVAAGALHAVAQVLGGVLGREWVDVEPPVDARVKRAVPAELELVVEPPSPDEFSGGNLGLATTTAATGQVPNSV